MTRAATVAPAPPSAASASRPEPPALECVVCEEEPAETAPAPECFVCSEEGGVLLTNICKCVDRHIHVECQRRMMALPRHRGVCAVCAGRCPEEGLAQLTIDEIMNGSCCKGAAERLLTPLS